jgi:hypothetical protein
MLPRMEHVDERNIFLIPQTDAALEALAERLHFEMERLDPSESAEWDGLSDADREFFRQCVKAVLSQPRNVHVLLRDQPFANNDGIDRRQPR